MTAVYYKQDVM